jgi:hypothetical protein
VRLRDQFLFELAWDDLFNLVLEAECNLGDFFGVDGWCWEALVAT